MTKSASQLVRELVKDMPFILELIRLDIINYSQLADYLKPSIEEKLGSNVNTLTVSMGLRRYAKEIKSNGIMNLKIDPSTDITSKSNLVEFIITKSPSLFGKINQIFKQLGNDPANILTVIYGTNNVTIITNSKHSIKIKKILNVEKIKTIRDHLGAIYLGMSPEYREKPGFIYALSKELAFHGLNILTMSNVDTEVVFLFEGKDVPKAFQVLYQLINRSIKS